MDQEKRLEVWVAEAFRMLSIFNYIFTGIVCYHKKKYFCSKAICEVQLPKATARGYYSLIYTCIYCVGLCTTKYHE